MKITGDLTIKLIRPEMREWEVQQEFTVELNDGRRLRIPAGAKTDFGSVPRLARWFVSTWKQGMGLAATVHDWLYRTTAHGFTKREADGLLYDMLVEFGQMSRLQTWAVWLAVTLGGRFPSSRWEE